MHEVNNFFAEILQIKIINSIIIVALSVIMYKSIIYFLNLSEKKSKFNLFTSKKSRTYLRFTKNIIRYIFIAITVLIILQLNGIDVSSVLAGVGILGVVFGLAIQDWLKDIIRGSNILSDNYFSVGDVVKYKETEGKVLVIGLKTTKIQDLKNQNIISIANRNIEEVEVVSNLIYVKIPMPYELPVERAEKAVNDIIEKVKTNDNVNDCVYKGITELAESSVQYYIEVNCNPNYKLQVRRDTLRSILLGLAENNIEVPYNQIDVHQKNH